MENQTMENQATELHIGKEEFEAVKVGEKPKFITGKGNIFDRINEWMVAKSKVKAKIKVTFFRLLATMLNSGVSLVKSLRILEDQTEDPKMKKICGHLAKSVEIGQPLSYAMEDFSDVFEESQIGMVKAGEASGQLNTVLTQIAEQVEKSSKIKSKIKGAMMYPMAIIIVLIVVVIAILVLVMPGLSGMFKESGKELPMATQMLQTGSDFLVAKFLGIPNWINVIVGIIIFLMLFKVWKNTSGGKFIWHKTILKFPIFGPLNTKVILAKFARGMSTLIKSGVSIVKTMSITSELVGNEFYKRRIMMIVEDVQKGITITENIKGDKKVFPVMLVSMIDFGEQTAQLGEVTAKIAEFYEDEVDNTVKNLSSLMEPLIILIIGGVVGFLVIAIMSPIMSMSETISG